MDGVGRVDVDTSEASPGAEARGRKRDSLFLSARLTINGETQVQDVRVRNLSAGGLMADYGRVLPPGTPVRLEMRGLGELTGSVAWCTRGRMGISLDQPIDPHRVRKPVGGGKMTPEFAKPVLVARAPRR